MVVLPDADISDPENESDSDVEDQPNSGSSKSSTDDDNNLLMDNIPLVNLATVQKGNFLWKKAEAKFDVHRFALQFTNPPDPEWIPVQFFRLFFTDDMFEHIVTQTLIYSTISNWRFQIDKS